MVLMKNRRTPGLVWFGFATTTRASAMSFVLALATLVLTSCQDRTAAPESAPPTATPAAPAATTNSTAPSNEAAAKFHKLVGRWLRPDGEYVLEVRSINAAGQIDAGYFNPNPIKIAKAEAKEAAGAIKVFVELRDTGYPGCTYNLTFDPTSDSLVGLYFQAALQQEFSVVFSRKK